MIVYAGSDIERAIQELKKRIAADGVLRELKSKRFFLSRSERRRVKDREAIKRRQRVEGKARIDFDPKMISIS
jgi:small subunit ribosomal protein S21